MQLLKALGVKTSRNNKLQNVKNEPTTSLQITLWGWGWTQILLVRKIRWLIQFKRKNNFLTSKHYKITTTNKIESLAGIKISQNRGKLSLRAHRTKQTTKDKDKLEKRKETCSRQMKNHMVAKLKHYKSNSFYNIKASYYVCYDTEI